MFQRHHKHMNMLMTDKFPLYFTQLLFYCRYEYVMYNAGKSLRPPAKIIKLFLNEKTANKKTTLLQNCI